MIYLKAIAGEELNIGDVVQLSKIDGKAYRWTATTKNIPAGSRIYY